jgi:hypothetical protein
MLIILETLTGGLDQIEREEDTLKETLISRTMSTQQYSHDPSTLNPR